MPARSRTPTGPRSPRSTSAACWLRSTRTRCRASRSRCSCRPAATTRPRRSPSFPVVGRRHLPPTRLLRAGALTADPLLLRGASVGAGWRAEGGGAPGASTTRAGGGLPILSGIPVVAALLDLAPWAMPEVSAAARRPVRAAAAGSDPARCGSRSGSRRSRRAAEARRLLRVNRDWIRVVPGRAPGGVQAARRWGPPRSGAARPPERYLVYPGGSTLARTSPRSWRRWAGCGARGPSGLPRAGAWPRASCWSAPARTTVRRWPGRARSGVGDRWPTRRSSPTRGWRPRAGARRPRSSRCSPRSAGFSAIEALASGTPVVASAVGALPELVGAAGILVEPRDATARRGARRGLVRRARTPGSRQPPANAAERRSLGRRRRRDPAVSGGGRRLRGAVRVSAHGDWRRRGGAGGPCPS